MKAFPELFRALRSGLRPHKCCGGYAAYQRGRYALTPTALVLSICTGLCLIGCSKSAKTGDQDVQMGVLEDATVEVGCGMCVYDMDEVKGCDLAVVIDGHPMLVSGYEIDMHEAGLCSGPKEAVVSGTVEGDEVVLTEVEIE